VRLSGRPRALLLAWAALAVSAPAVSAQWAAGRGGYWAKLSAFHHSTDEQFRSNGDKRPFLNADARSRSSAVFLDLLYGVTDHLDLWVQVPYFDLTFNDAADNRTSTGVGDIRLSARYNLLNLKGGALPIAARFTVKVPVVDFPIDAEVIPVGEGQWDYEAWLEGGMSFWPLPAYAVLWLGYRWRATNDKTTRDPGDERMLLAEIGGTISGPLGAKLIVDGLFGTNGAIQGVKVKNDEREILYLEPAVTYQVTSAFSLEAGTRFPLRGKNFPAGPQFTIALFHRGKVGS